MGDDIEWLSTERAAKRVGVTVRTLYRFIDEGELPAYRFGRVIRVKADDVATFIDSHLVEPGTIGHLYPPAYGGARTRPGKPTRPGAAA